MALVLRRPVIAVTGSSGKTTSKEMIASILSKRWRVFKSPGNRNNRKSIRQYARQIRRQDQVVVLEYGMSALGHLRNSCRIIQPNIGVITMIGTAHIGNVGGSVKGIIRAKSELIANMKQTGTLFLNGDDPHSKFLQTARFKGRIITVGIDNEADYRASDYYYNGEGMVFFTKLDGMTYNFFIPIFGRHNVYNALFALAVAHHLGCTYDEIVSGLREFEHPARRLQLYLMDNNLRIIDDTFNANPDAAKAAIDVLTHIGGGENVAVLATMAELGPYSQKGHADVGAYVASQNLAHLFTYGREAKIIGQAAIDNGVPAEKVTQVEKRSILHRHLQEFVKPGTTVLIKGSHSMNMNKTVQFLQQITI